MKKFTLKLSLLLFVLSTVATSCDKVKDLISINVTAQSSDINFLIQPQAAGSGVLSEFNAGLNIDSLIKDNAGAKYSISNIKSVKLESCMLTLTNADDANSFGNIASCKAEMSSNTKPTMVNIAELTANPETAASSLTLPVNTSVELKDYFSSTSFSYKLTGALRKPVTKVLNCKATFKYKIQVSL